MGRAHLTMRGVTKWVVLAVGGFVLLLVAAWLAWWSYAQAQVREVRAQLAAAGLPMTVEELVPADHDAEENAAPMLEQSGELLREIKAGEGFIMAAPGSRWEDRAPELFDAERLAVLRGQMDGAEMQEALALLREASTKQRAIFNRDYNAGPLIEVEPVTGLIDAGWLLGTTAWLAAKDGDPRAAVSNLLAVSRLASFGLRDVLLIGWLVGVAVDQMSVNQTAAALAVLPEGAFHAEDWQPLSEQWARQQTESEGGLVRVMDGERVFFGDWIFDLVLGQGMSLRDFFAPMPSEDLSLHIWSWLYQFPLRPLLVMDQAAYLRFMFEMRAAAEQPDEMNGVGLVERIPRTAFFTRLTAPGLEGVLGRAQEYPVLLQLGRIGLELEGYRAVHGEYPASLNELGLPAEELTDPFSGQPFVYQPSADGVVLYSFGRNRVDDGGVTREDLVWRIERAAR